MKRVLTASAVGLGLGGIGATISGNDAERDAGDAGQRGQHEHQPDLALLFADDYHSNALFRPIDRLPQRAVNAIFGYSGNEGDSAVSEPADYNGYVVLIKQTPNAQGEYTFAFVNEETLREDQWYRLTDDVVFFDARIRLLSVALAAGAGGRETSTTEETTATNAVTTTRTSETTTHKVIVKATETNDGE